MKFLSPRLIQFLKLAVAAGLIYWLVSAGKLDFTQLSLVFKSPQLFLITVFGWFFISVILGSLRWWTLLRGVNLVAPYLRALQLQMIGLFFNATMPGSVGGDIVKGFYIIKDQEQGDKTPAMLTVLFDRIIGLMALFFMGAIVLLSIDEPGFHDGLMRQVSWVTYFGASASLAFLMLLLIPMPGVDALVDKLLQRKIVGFSLLHKIAIAAICYRQKPFTLIFALLISVVCQIGLFTYFWYLSILTMNQSIDPFKLFAIFPVGMLLTALPLAPGGLGVGHLAFERLYQIVGLSEGATVFNIFALCSLFMSLSGVIPYLVLRPKTPMEVEMAENQRNF